MTVSSTVSRVVHTANGSSVFFSSAPIQGLTASTVVVTLTNTNGVTTTQVLGTDYTLSPSGVTFTTAPAAGTIVTIRRVVDLLQPDQFETNSPFPAKIAENRLDQIVFGLQQAADDSNRAIRLHPSDTVSGALPPAAVRANKYLAFAADGSLTYPVAQPLGPNAAEAYWWGGTAGGTANALTLLIAGAPGSYAAGQRYAFVVAANNTGAATLAVNGLGAKSIRRPDGSTLAAGDLVAGTLVAVTYDGTDFRLAWSSTLNADLTIAKSEPELILDKTASGQVARVVGSLNGAWRWGIELGDWQSETGSNAGSDFRIVRYADSGLPISAPIIINRASGAVTLEAPLTLPSSNPTNADHATRKAYVDAGDRWVTLVDAAIANSAIIDVTGFSLADYYLVEIRLLNALPTTNSSVEMWMQVYRSGSLVSTGYTSCWFALSQAGTAYNGVSNHTDCRLSVAGIQTQPLTSQITISQTAANSAIFLNVQTVHQENFSNILQAPRVHCRLTAGSGWVDGFRIVSPVSFTANVGRIVVVGLKK